MSARSLHSCNSSSLLEIMRKNRPIRFSIQSSPASLKQMLVMACATSKDWPSLSLFIFFSKSAKEIHIITTDKSVLSSKTNGPCLFFLSFFLWSRGLYRKATKENTHVEPHIQGTQSRNAPPWLQLHSHVTFNFLLSPLTNTGFVSGLAYLIDVFIFKTRSSFKWSNQTSLSCCGR